MLLSDRNVLLDNNLIQFRVFRKLHQIFAFNIQGNWAPAASQKKDTIFSCLIPSSRPNELKNILEDLTVQDFPKENFEVIMIKSHAQESIGSLRNETLRKSHGKYILFLDDDTRIYQRDFLTKALQLFEKYGVDIIQPMGKSRYGIVQGKHDFYNPFSFSTCCCMYRRALLEKIGGFRNDLNSYSDIELSMRAMIVSAKVVKTEELIYFHPPMYFPNLQKPLSMGKSIFKLRCHYPLLVWLLIYLNALRFLPLGLWPFKSNRFWFMISLGVLLYPLRPGEYYHQNEAKVS